MEEIQQRRQEIAELRHSESVYRDIIARENEKTEKNKEFIRGALLNSLQLFAELLKKKNVNRIFELFNFNCDKEFVWIDEYSFTSLKKEAINLLASKEIIK